MESDVVLGWLLTGDPAVRWQVRRDLLDEPADVVAGERARVATEGWGARLLAEQSPDGTWSGGLYNPKWTSTTYTLLLLRQLGLPPGPQTLVGCQRLLDGARWFDGGLTFAKSVPEPEACITSMVISIAAAFEAVDERVAAAMAWLLDQQLTDGGWNCDSVRTGSTHGSFNTTILALEALSEWQTQGKGDRDTTLAAERGREFFLDHRLCRSHRTGELVNRSFTRLVFPPGWHHDLLRGLDHFQQAGAPIDGRLTDAIDVLRSRRRADGTWPAYTPHPGRYWFELETPGQASRINTLRALRVLRWWDNRHAQS